MAIQDYSDRINENADEIRSSVSVAIQLSSNIYFTFVFITRIIAFGLFLGGDTFENKIWSLLNLLDLIGGLVFYFIHSNSYFFFRYGKFIRYSYVESIFAIMNFLKPLRIIQEIEGTQSLDFN